MALSPREPLVDLDLRSFAHDDAAPCLRALRLSVRPGEILAVTGASGSGKSTLGQILGGLLPTGGGDLDARLRLGETTLEFVPGRGPRVDHAAWGQRVAYLPQDVRTYLSGARGSVAEEIAFGLEYRGLARAEQHRRVVVALRTAGIEHLADRDPGALSGGQERLVAFACAAVLEPNTLVLDEPGAGLDDASLLAMERALRDHALRGGAVVILAGFGEPLQRLAARTVDLGKMVREEYEPAGSGASGGHEERVLVGAAPALELRGLDVRRGDQVVLRGLDLTLRPGECLAVTGPNGVGKTTLLRGILGLEHTAGLRRAAGQDLPAVPAAAAREVAVMFQNPSDQLTETTVARELGVVLPGVPEEALEDVLAGYGLVARAQDHPFDLPAAGRRLLCLAQAMERGTGIVLLDEPGAGLDRAGRDVLVRRVRAACARGRAVLVVTHDAALVRDLADRVQPLG